MSGDVQIAVEESRVLAVVDEIQARSPDFFTANVLAVHGEEFRSALHDVFPASDARGLDELGDAVRRAWQGRGVRCDCGDAASDPVARELLRGLRDAARPELTGGVGSPEATDLGALVRSEYREIAGPAGSVRGYVRRRAGRPLLLLNALGLSIGIWSRLLGGEHDHQVIVPVLPSCDPFDGGMTETSSARQLASMLGDLLRDLDLPEVDVLAWCNGGRIGVELMRQAGPSIARLVLLSPTFRGGITPGRRTSPYEDNLDKLFSMVAEVPSRAGYASTMLRLPQPAPDWQQFAGRPEERARQLFSMPRNAFNAVMTRPMATAESLVHYVRRTYLDEAISGEAPTPLPGDRVVLIQGSHDSIVDNVQTREWLGERAPGFTCYEVSGAGHYVHDLQYPYLAHVLHRVLGTGATAGELPARVREVSGGAP